MDHRQVKQSSLAGSLLVAVPTLLDPNFRRTIVFLTRHETEDGALGVILNRPCQRTLKEVTDPPKALEDVPVFEGGPVETHNLLLARILLLENEARLESLEREDVHGNPQNSPPADHHGFRAFTGYAGWSAGQLEAEVREKSWLILPPTPALLQTVTTPEEGVARWRTIMRELGSWYRLLAEAPDDLSLN